MDNKDFIAARAAKELKNGDIVNLGIGLPTKVVDFLPDNVTVYLHSENGILGLGPTPAPDQIDRDLVNAGKQPVSIISGSSFFDSAASFAMIRGGHVTVSVLGVLQVDAAGRIANWAVPGKAVLGVGGAMDLLEGSKKVIVTMQHTTKEGQPKIVETLTYPMTSERNVDVIITDLAVFHVVNQKLFLTDLAPGVTMEEVKEKTNAAFEMAETLELKK